MYKEYEIMAVDTTDKQIIIKFKMEGRVDYITRRYYLTDELDDVELLRLVEHAQSEAFEFYKRDLASVPFTPASWTGTLRDIEQGEIPEYKPNIETLEEEWIETETKRTRVLKVVPLSIEEKARVALLKRNELLSASDTAALSDRNLTKEMREYRQALRDITDQPGFPDEIFWPVEPLG